MPKKTQTAKKPTTPTKRIALKPQKCRFCAEKVTEIDYIKLVADIDRAKKELSTSKREDAVPQ
ncbi:MAG: hypothetical protein LBN25_03425 [Christensenellaceae bacterium]|jgi:hypothetical protein|nr:hypothetical protein [Christensenellaceae bacterium]